MKPNSRLTSMPPVKPETVYPGWLRTSLQGLTVCSFICRITPWPGGQL
jgi:hypothetical protein